jgi:adenylate kinase
MFNLLLFGPPGSGKGTQAEFIEKELGIKRLVTGDILREEVRKQTELGMQAKSYMDRGVLVPDHLVISMIRERLLQPEYQNGIGWFP